MTSFLCGLLLGGAVGSAAAAWLYRRRLLLIGRLFGFAAHEINTPITAINMTILNFLSGVFGPIRDDQLRWMEMLRTQTSRLNGIVGEFRDLIHFEVKRDLMIRVEETSVDEAIDSVLQSVKNGIPAAELNLELELAQGLRPVSADPDRLPRSISSLLFHARKFRTGGSILLKTAPRGDAVEVSIEYQGQKMSPDEAAASLALYYPAFKRKDQLLAAVGMGLGAIREIVRLQGGELSLDVDGQGRARLTLSLPQAAAAAPAK